MSAEKALEQLGSGYLRHPENEALRQKLRDGQLSSSEFGRQLRLIVYRLVVAAITGTDRYEAISGGDSFKPCPPWLAEIPDLEPAKVDVEDVYSVVYQLAVDRNKTDELGRLYLEALDLEPEVSVEEGTVRMVAPAGRRTGGVFYTPDILVDCLLDHSLEPVIESLTARKSAEDAEHALLDIKVLDPAVGSGRFLIAAARRLTRRVAQIRSSRRVSSLTAAREVVEKCLFGVDIDSASLDLTRIALWLEAGRPEEVGLDWPPNLRVGNALVGANFDLVAPGIPDRAYDPLGADDSKRCADLKRQNRAERAADETTTLSRETGDAWCAAHTAVKSASGNPVPTNADLQPGKSSDEMRDAIAGEKAIHRFFHWPIEFSGARFDVVVGNPPFANAIERDLEDRSAGIMAARTPIVGGTADLAFRFLAAATDWVREGGRIAMIQPRAALNARSLDRFRASVPNSLKPRMLCALDRADLFRGADVFVALIVLGPDGPCKVPDPDGFPFESWREVPSVASNWFIAALGKSESAPVPGNPISETFEVAASMIAAEAYAAKPYVIDSVRGKGQKLMTTGLIDPSKSLWGTEDCRYLKARFRHPRLVVHSAMPASLQRRLRASQRPKVLVGGLGSRVEAFLDEKGEYQGAVSTYSIFHPNDDSAALTRLAEYLNTPEVTERMRSELGANALGGGSITIKKEWLRQLSVPSES